VSTSTSPAENVRELLAAARRRGEPFQAAWRGAIETACPADPPDSSTRARREADAWRTALEWARPAFRRSYRGEVARGAEIAAAALDPAA
jgi:hypothetical protein